MTRSISRRSFVKAAAFTSFAGSLTWAETKTTSGAKLTSPEESNLLFVGTQTGPSSKGIYAFHWDAATGALTERGLAVESNNPTFLALSPDGKHLYSANEVSTFEGAKSGAVSSFSIDRAAARLTAINAVASTGTGTCHVSLDHTGRALFCANYGGGSAASFHLDANGKINPAASQFQYEGHGSIADRQEKSHAHRATVSPDNRWVYINDLGLDCIHIYHLDAATAKLTPAEPSKWTAQPGSGPRALRFHPSGKWAYCVHEMASAVEVLAWNSANGSLTSVERLNLLPDDYKGDATGCEIVFDRQGRFAYVAERTYDHIIAFNVDAATGKLSLLDRTSCGGKIPRHIALDPTDGWLLVANQESDNIAILRRDAQSGKLEKTGSSLPLIKPQCLVFV